ncbi:acetyltransferase [Variovorax sp. PCZ-1]|uniref:acetyltransferase n=1 Tax=Variovorax sp. PCZ-1 TaxID=2835533 RepID=UPI001BCD54E3|nr:acetyltransferase [Variovorax sp. PCZ-1]MBS7808220.1 acetyltransferase [Variovorax sp. PCZ-1]
MKKYYGIVGAGGHGRETMHIARVSLAASLSAEEAELFFVIEGDVEAQRVNGIPVISIDTFLSLPGERFFNVAIGSSKVRERISDICELRRACAFSITAANSMIFDTGNVGVGSIMSPFTMVTANTKIGKHFHANMYSYVAHDCIIGDFVTFAPGVKCNGNVIIEDHAYIGAGAVIKQGTYSQPRIIGRGAVVGMGAVVTKDVAANETVVGNPARPISK